MVEVIGEIGQSGPIYLAQFDLGQYDIDSNGGFNEGSTLESALNIMGRWVYYLFYLIILFFRYQNPLGIRSETVYGNETWEKEKWQDAEIARIYTDFPVTGWIFSDPRLARLGRLVYEEDEDHYQKAGHM